MPRVDTESFYRAALDAHGETAEGVHWNSRDNQQVRFRVLRSFLPEDLSCLSIVDAGCGFGDFFCYLQEQDALPKRYVGLDVMEPMVAAARKRTGCEIRLFDVLTESLPTADYYVCSGAMNTLTREETEVFIRNCFEASQCGFVFNLLKGWDTSSTYNLYRPSEMQQFARHLGAECDTQDGYLWGDFTAAFTKRAT